MNFDQLGSNQYSSYLKYSKYRAGFNPYFYGNLRFVYSRILLDPTHSVFVVIILLHPDVLKDFHQLVEEDVEKLATMFFNLFALSATEALDK
jgi:hypothetical protein